MTLFMMTFWVQPLPHSHWLCVFGQIEMRFSSPQKIFFPLKIKYPRVTHVRNVRQQISLSDVRTEWLFWNKWSKKKCTEGVQILKGRFQPYLVMCVWEMQRFFFFCFSLLFLPSVCIYEFDVLIAVTYTVTMSNYFRSSLHAKKEEIFVTSPATFTSLLREGAYFMDKRDAFLYGWCKKILSANSWMG